MNILQVSHSFYPCLDAGGVVRVVYEISKELVAKGHNVTVYTTDGCTKRLNVEKNVGVSVDGIKVYYFRNLSNKLRIKLKIATPYHLFRVIKKEIKNFDVIHIHEHRTILAVVVHHYAKKYGVPYVVQAHGSVMPIFQKSLFKKVFDKIWGQKILNDASKVIALTKTESEQYQKMGVPEDKIEIVPNGINLSEYQNLPRKGQFKKKYGIKNSEKVILYLGRLHKTKGIDLLIKTFSEISKELDNVKLVIAGPDDGFLTYLKDLSTNLMLNNNLIFTGPIYKNEKRAAYVDADVFVTPSFSGFPMTFLESCACGTPIVTTSNGNNLSWINNEVGFVVGYDVNHLNHAILDIVRNEELKFKFGKNGKDIVIKKFNWNKVSKTLENIYKTCMENMK